PKPQNPKTPKPRARGHCRAQYVLCACRYLIYQHYYITLLFDIQIMTDREALIQAYIPRWKEHNELEAKVKASKNEGKTRP
ncbi:MAG: hypothetical protein P4L10_17480, partial [Acidobacteriaceae bacterium]|nr:hypothetical protein [Acidobacteriaceae bacterium]